MNENKELDIFIENIINKYKLDKTNQKKIREIIIASITINYYADIQFILFKRYLEKKINKSIKDENIYELVKLIKPKLKDNYTFFSTKILTTDDRRKMYNDVNILLQIFDKNLVNESMLPGISFAIDKLRNYDFSIIANRRDCIENIKTKSELMDIGIENYIEKNLKIILKL